MYDCVQLITHSTESSHGVNGKEGVNLPRWRNQVTPPAL